jgi:hypothetical protein
VSAPKPQNACRQPEWGRYVSWLEAELAAAERERERRARAEDTARFWISVAYGRLPEGWDAS